MAGYFLIFMEKYFAMVIQMGQKIKFLFLLFILFSISFHPAFAEKISLKFSYKQNSISDGDLNTWIKSFNSLWKDWENSKGGRLEGTFSPISYGFNFEVEMRIPIISRLFLNLSGGRLSDDKEGNITYHNEEGNQTEHHFISNQITAWPFKIGFSFSYPLPLFPRLSVFASAGRHIIFVQYKSSENYEALFKSQEKEFSYWFKKENSFNSEALGYYATLGAEYALIEQIAFVVEAEKIWSKVDGFKGPYTYESFDGQNDSGKASLFYYESNSWGLSQYYSVLTGHEKRPEDTSDRNIRQGELNFSGFSFKIGIRLKF